MYQGIRSSTKRTYSSAQKSFLAFCQEFSLCPMPASEQIILWYIAYLRSHKVHKIKSNSLNVYLAAIRSLHIMEGFESPPIHAPRVKLALKAILEQDPPTVQKYPITYTLLARMLLYLGDNFDEIMYKAVLTVAFFGALRCDEFAVPNSPEVGEEYFPLYLSHISFGVTVSGKKYMSLFIPKSKTTIHGFKLTIGCSTTPVCAVCLTKQYIKLRYALYKCDLSHHLFVHSNGMPLTKSETNACVKCLVSKLGLDSALFSAHSLRAGVASTAASVKTRPFQDWELKAIGNWKSDTYQRYIRDVEMHTIEFSERLTQ